MILDKRLARYFTASLKTLPGTNLGALDAGILISLPV
jgi:hypothetical protein